MRARQIGTGVSGAAPSENQRIQQVLFRILAANFQLTSDQALTKVFSGTEYLITGVHAIRRSGGATVACAGGIYTAASKGGTALVAAAQSWLGITGTLGVQVGTIAVPAASSATLFVSLTTGSTGAVTADLLVTGFVLS
jgi:hypothetical protein